MSLQEICACHSDLKKIVIGPGEKEIPTSMHTYLQALVQEVTAHPINHTAWISVRNGGPCIASRTSSLDRIDYTLHLLMEMYSEPMGAELPQDADLFLFADDNPPENIFPIMAYSSRELLGSRVIRIPSCSLLGMTGINLPRLDTWSQEWLTTKDRDIPFGLRKDTLFWAGGLCPYRVSFLRVVDRTPHTLWSVSSHGPGDSSFVPLIQQNQYKYILDMQGLGWSGRLMFLVWMGCVVFIAQRDAHEYWVLDHFKPWVHFVPVANDGSDLQLVLERVMAMPDKGESIAVACRSAARMYVTEKHSKEHFAVQLKAYVALYGTLIHTTT